MITKIRFDERASAQCPDEHSADHVAGGTTDRIDPSRSPQAGPGAR